MCGKLLTPYTGKDLIQHLYEGINIYFNYTGTTKCLNISQQATSDLGDLGWDYQVCMSFSRVMVWNLSYDVASGSEITPCNKIDKPLVVYRFSNVTELCPL